MNIATLTGLALLLTASGGLSAQQAVDRTRPPALAPPPELHLPAIETATLPNGLQIRLVRMTEVPLVQFQLLVAGGSRQDGALAGLATFTAGMLDEGAGTRDALGIAAQAEFLGASLSTSATWDQTAVTLRVPRRTMTAALDLMADVVLRPTFVSAEVTRQRDLRLAGILQQRDQPNAVANLVFNAELFPADHPYHRSPGGDSLSTAALDSATVRNFYDQTMVANRATLLVTGDITLAEARREIAARFGGWKAGAALERTAQAPPPVDRPTTLYLVDKPGAAQSVLFLGHRGIPRDHPDWFAVEVMNTILGGSFSSRLMTNLRETKGYTYGAGSRFQNRPIPGPFLASSQVRTNVTDSSLVEFMRELEAIRTAPVAPTELDRAKAYLALGLPGDFETTGQMAGQLAELLTYGQEPAFFESYVQRVMGVTAEDVQRVARTWIDPDRMVIVVVGDLTQVRPGIERLGLGAIELREPQE